MPEPLFASIELQLRFESEVPEWISGKALHGLAFRYMRAADSAMADCLHAAEFKPFTVSLLRPVKGKPQEMRWRWTILDTPLYEALSKLLYSEWRRARDRRLLGSTYVLADCQMDGGGRSTLCRAEDLLEAAKSSRQARIRLVSPTAFKKGGNQVTLFPQPDLVWGGLTRRIRKLIPGLIDTSWPLERFSELRVSEYSLSTRLLEFPGFVMKGVQGRIAYEAPRSWGVHALETLAILLQAAPFLGVGAKTTHGMGQCMVWRERDRVHRA